MTTHITTAVTHNNIPFDLSLGSVEVRLHVSHAKDNISFEMRSHQGELLGREVRTVSDICAALAGRLPGMASKPPGRTA